MLYKIFRSLSNMPILQLYKSQYFFLINSWINIHFPSMQSIYLLLSLYPNPITYILNPLHFKYKKLPLECWDFSKQWLYLRIGYSYTLSNHIYTCTHSVGETPIKSSENYYSFLYFSLKISIYAGSHFLTIFDF